MERESAVARPFDIGPLRPVTDIHTGRLLHTLPRAADTSLMLFFLRIAIALWCGMQNMVHGAFHRDTRCRSRCGIPSKKRLITKNVGRRTQQDLRLLYLLCLSVGFLLTQYAQATLVASSRIIYCTDGGDDAINCTKKMVVTLTVEAGQQADEESLVFLNSAVDETTSTGTATNTTTTVNFAPIAITTSRSAVRYRYPIFYVQNYNAKPYEATVKGRLLNQCNADFDSGTATCGIAYDAFSKAIPFSQGFCCDCSMCQTLGFCVPDARANQACNLFDAYTTASCLRFGQRWYSGYTIGSYITWLTLNVTVSRNITADPPNGSNGIVQSMTQQTVVLQLSPSVLGDNAGGGWGASARLVGSFAPTDQPLDLTSRMLFAPALPLTDERVRAGAAEWIVLPNTLVTLDGTECNKVGVSYEAFASQGNRCNLRPGSCLSSQLEDYRTSDLARVAAGKKAQYMATGYGDFDLERVWNTSASPAEQVSPYISYIAASPAAAMIVLTVDADDLEYHIGVANGKILSAALNNATLEADTRDGVLSAVIQNVAAVTGRLVVSVENCTKGVFPMAAQVLSLGAQQQFALRFNVYMQDYAVSADANCSVVVRNAEEVVTDTRVVSWTVVAPGFNNGTQGGTAGGGGGGSKEESSAVTCGTCGTLNVACASKRGCWGLVLLDLVVYLIIAAVIFCVFWFRRIVCCCFYTKHCHCGDHRRRHDRSRSRSRSSSSNCSRGHGRSCSPTREESRDDYEAGRRSRSHRGLPRHHRHCHLDRGGSNTNNSSRSSHHLRDLAVMPHPPPMTYAIAPCYPAPALYQNGYLDAASTSPFSSPLRVQPPSWLSPSPPRALPPALMPPPYAYSDVDPPSRLSSPPAFPPELSGEFTAFPASPSRSPSASCVSNRRERLHSPAPGLPPLVPASSARDARSEYDLAPENELQWRSYCNRSNTALVSDPSRPSTPSSSMIRLGCAPYS
ncbi:hypothetical protein ABB37_00219 [Leptomonas pyrrhocoris]|uniref:Generative cell specific-1/HAP2 domain-containing protein n=1 Tax=Leptomonas pyrrhocoris TaxID=157538 RepID=A0A0M9GA28_LEPPY|nr:hypothetical protein ABB37_00219 [Leptomonas pyrrhocoris]KPA85907.1 hypothetical protein ABB37_00219 [Leptomonas pyrrhocoris]|eukprot:XP_015664346.1 hypothetical protein ABB37_00219 [Leptomonas pyrrhocoris]